MVYLCNTDEPQTVFVPKNGVEHDGPMAFSLRSTVGHGVTVDGVTDLNTSGLYYNIAVALPAAMPGGEYEYALTAGELVLSEGIAVIGESAKVHEYEKNIEYRQYGQ